MSGDKRIAAGTVLSSVFLAAVIVIATAYGLGMRTSYANGVDSRLGSQIQRDFLIDQEAEAAALSNGDASALNNRLTDAALVDVVQQISDRSARGSVARVSFQAASLTILRAQDPADPSLVIEVQEDGTKTVNNSNDPDSAPSQQTIGFHGDFWLRLVAGRYAIADQNIQLQPNSPLASMGLIAAALAVVAISGVLVFRQRRLLGAVPKLVRAAPDVRVPEVIEVGDVEAAPEPELPPAEILIRTFGGLQVRQGGKDWAGALSGRPITGFVWLRLLIAAIRDPHARPTREEIARQASPGLDREVQLRRLRNFIYQGVRELPAVLKDRVVVEPQVLRFKLDGADVDAVSLIAITAECSGRPVLSRSQIAKGLRILEASAGVFLPEFETVEDIATDHHPTCTELIQQLRNLLAAKRADLAIAIAASHLASSRTAPAISLLERALMERPDDANLATSLAAAYRRGGREAEASGLESRLTASRA